LLISFLPFPQPRRSSLFPYTTLFRSCAYLLTVGRWLLPATRATELVDHYELGKYITELRVMPESSLIGTSVGEAKLGETFGVYVDRKSTRLNSSHVKISYAVFCLTKK